MSGADPRAFRDAIGRFPTGVTVVTTLGPDGPAGLTTNAVTSLSLDPLLLLVCFDNGSRTLPAVRSSERFGVNVLASDQGEIARVFASKAVAAEKFAAVTHVEEHGVPVLDGAAAWIACSLRELLPGGDHTIGIGEVLGTHVAVERAPLVFADGAYRVLAPDT
ncbi:MAG: flavin reductase family protein [Solirubrobacteraceae bacterium]|nr:flavin reductase family protein [Solirubrobacteraceae bacterium]